MLLSITHGRSNLSNPPIQNPVTDHEHRAASIEANLAEIDKTWHEYMATYLTPEEKLLASSFISSYTTLVEKGIKPGIALMKKNDMAGLEAHLRDIVVPLDSKCHEAIHALTRLQDTAARTELARNASDYRARLTISIIGTALAVLAGIVISALTIRSVTGTADRLRESEGRFRTLFEQAAVGVAEIDPVSGRFLHVNKRYCDIVGFSLDEMLKTDFQSITHPDDLEADLSNMKSLIAGEINEFSMEKRYIRKDGGIVWVSLTVYPTWLWGESPSRHIAIVEDITERKTAENALRSSEEKFFKAFHATPDAIVLSRVSDGLLLEVNEVFCRLTGYPRDEAIGRTTVELNLWADLHDRERYFAKVREHGKIREMEASFRTQSGEIRDGLVSSEGIVLGNEPCFLTIIRDVTERKKTDAELRKYRLHLEDIVNERTEKLKAANEKLKELDRLKSMFIASMSHELRTPLNSIIGFTGMTLQGLSGELNDEQKDNLSRAYQAAKHLLSLITDVIDISKIEAGRIESYPEAVSLDEVIDEAIGTVRPQLNEKRLGLVLEVPAGVRLNTDRKRLLQCLLNFLSNAVKYTESGTITVAARETEGQVTVSVSDTGIGIAEEDQPKVFEAFERLESHLRVKAGGTGLGLYLTQKLARDILRGDVMFQSKEGQGSTFTLRVPKDLQQKVNIAETPDKTGGIE
jgi:PAS domain S-box-containing protein